MIKIGFCDDEKHYLGKMVTMMRQELEDMKLEYDIEAYQSSHDFLDDYKKSKESFDLIFLDIEMGEMDGITLAKRIREIDEQVVIVFFTMMENRVYDTFGYNIFRFIVKNQEEGEIIKLFRECIKYSISLKTAYVFNTPEGTIRVRENEIVYFERNLRKFYINTTKTKIRIIAEKFEQILEKVGECNAFQMPNRSILTNLRYVNEITKDNEVILQYGNKEEKVLLSRGRKKEFYDSFISYIK